MAELFANFEVNRESRVGVLLRLVGASVIVHMIFLWAIFYVPAFRDTLNIASLIANTRWVDKAYARTEISDEVELIDLAANKFHYPEGYFATEAQLALNGTSGQQVDPYDPKIISRAEKQREEPSPTPTVSPSPSPSASPGSVAAASPSPSASPLTAEQAQDQLEKNAADNNLILPDENQINKKALRDFAAYANDMKNQGRLDLDKPFEVVIEAEMDQNGKLKNSRFTKKAGDPNLVELFSRMVAAMNDSGLLIYLQPLNKDNPGTKIIFTIKQGEKEVLASVESEASSSDSARVLSKALNGSLVLGAISRQGKDEAELMKNTNVAPDGKRIVINFSMPRQTVVDMIKKQLEPGA